MHLPEEAELLRIFIGESDKHGHRPLYEAIVLLARQRGIAGATVLRGIMGFGADSHLHTAKVLRLSEDLPIVIEVVDREEKLDALLAEIDPMIEEGLITRERVRVITYRAGTDATKRRGGEPGPEPTGEAAPRQSDT